MHSWRWRPYQRSVLGNWRKIQDEFGRAEENGRKRWGPSSAEATAGTTALAPPLGARMRKITGEKPYQAPPPLFGGGLPPPFSDLCGSQGKNRPPPSIA